MSQINRPHLVPATRNQRPVPIYPWLNFYSDNIELSDGFIYASDLLERTRQESKFDIILDSLHAEIEIKCGRNIEEMKKAYKMTEDRPKVSDKKKKRK